MTTAQSVIELQLLEGSGAATSAPSSNSSIGTAPPCSGSPVCTCAVGRSAEEVAQEAWLGALRGIDRFEGRSSFRTWLFRIVTNVAETRPGREARSVPFLALVADDA